MFSPLSQNGHTPDTSSIENPLITPSSLSISTSFPSSSNLSPPSSSTTSGPSPDSIITTSLAIREDINIASSSLKARENFDPNLSSVSSSSSLSILTREENGRRRPVHHRNGTSSLSSSSESLSQRHPLLDRQVHFAEDDEDEESDDEPADEIPLNPADLGYLPDINSLPRYAVVGSTYEGEDFLRLRRWLSELPRGRCRSERSLLQLQDISLIQGGTINIIRGNGITEMGSANVDLDGLDVDWERDLNGLASTFRNRQNWSGVRLWELLPEGCQPLLGRMPIGVTPEIQTRSVPRSTWRPPILRRTSAGGCVGCLCVELEGREVYDRERHSWAQHSRSGTLQSWRHRQDRVHQFIFRRHSCALGIHPLEVWRGILSQTERGCRGGAVGWEVTFRAFIHAAIPSGFPHQYTRGMSNIDIFFPFPNIFRVMMGEGIRMHGKLRWDGFRPSRGQPIGFTWEPATGDGEGMTGPVRFSHWVFTSDFIYGNRRDVDIRLISLQVGSFLGVDSHHAISSSRWDYQPPRVVLEGIEERNSQRQRERRQRRPREVSEDEEDGDLPDSQNRSRRGRRRRRRSSSFPGEDRLSLTQPPVSSALTPPLRSILRSPRHLNTDTHSTPDEPNTPDISIASTVTSNITDDSPSAHTISAADLDTTTTTTTCRPVRQRRRSARFSDIGSETEGKE